MSQLAAACAGRAGQQFEHRLPHPQLATGLGFLIYLPVEYDSGADFPVIFHLHGGGEGEGQSGEGPLTKDGVNTLAAVKAHGIPAIVEGMGSSAPFVVVSPQCPSGTRGGWQSAEALAALDRLADTVTEELRVDRSRVYLTGLSMGGYGTWAWAAHSPERFAAVAPVCGGWGDDDTRPAAIEAIKGLPHFITHAVNDKIVPVATSDTMVAALEEAGCVEIIYRRYPESPAPYQPTDDSPRRADGSEGAPNFPSDLSGHDSWTQTYTDPDFYRWLLAHRKASSPSL